ncbi:hypothetical protein CQ14_06605 [Bradyrhizobium lablabi]|uniref:Uncharacterized protein n=1 Tax=Bradyrhizobium lablabi TaxID=722472 RepID=A0A0R3MM80_9BRAD|nr:hypothetical protein [Bradyrhizobium lablabi]KRR21314.1 hypothetical protein CQ14_06605 [Bradyrhizobium lablabi]
MTKVAHLSEIPSNGSLDRHAAILADIQKMRDELVSTHDTNDQLRADLHREEDRVALLVQERDRWRTEALIFRSRLIELATAMANIGLLTRSAQEIVLTVNELNNATSSEALGKLEEAFEQGNHAAA